MIDHYGHEAGEWLRECSGCNRAAGPPRADVWDAAIEAAAHNLETIVEYQWNGNPRRPSNYRRAAQDVRGTPNPYRSSSGQ